jgi:hypothetical protein
MMHKNLVLSAVVALLLGATVMVADAGAGACLGACDYAKTAQVDIFVQGQGGGYFGDGFFKRKKRRIVRPPLYGQPPPPYAGDEDYSPQGYDEDGGRGGLIGPTEALNQALMEVPNGTALGVKLLRGATPMYAVKMRVGGRVIRVLVDARTAQVLGE